MRAFAVVSLFAACAVGGCGGDGDAGDTLADAEPASTEPAAPSSTEQAAASSANDDVERSVEESASATVTGDDEAVETQDGASPADVVESELAAQMEGDWETVAALWADDAVAVQPDGTEIGFHDEVPFPIDDFDGDGVVTIMDDHLATAAITPAMGKTIAAECNEVSDNVVDCTETTSNAFSEAAGVDPLVLELQLTVEDGRIVRQELIGPVGDPAAFETATMSGFADYDDWVAETAPDEHPVMFNASGMAMTMEAVELHNQMLPAYVEVMSG
mgnify:CR=1 FL=1